MKCCIKCGENKTLDSYPKGKNSCKSCVKIAAKLYQQEYYLRNKTEIDAKHTKYREDNLERSREIIREHYRNNKDKIAARKKQYYEDNPGKKRERVAKSKEYRDTHSEALSEQKKVYRAANLDKLRRNAIAYHKVNRDKRRMARAKRRAAELAAIPSWADMQSVQLCFTKARRVEVWLETPLHIDHIVPLLSPNVCGLHCAANLQILSPTENMAKGNRHWPDMWEPLQAKETKNDH